MTILRGRSGGWGIAAVLCIGLALGARERLTALMSLHMLVQIPLLVLGGLFAEQALHAMRRVRKGTASRDRVGPAWSWNAYGLPGLVFATLIGAVWMVPKALDDALVDWRVATFKYVGLPVCGWIVGASVRQSNAVVKLFFLGNFCWMSAIVGMVYLDQPVRLCNAYLLDDQLWSGRGLIAYAIGLPLAWGLVALGPMRRRRPH